MNFHLIINLFVLRSLEHLILLLLHLLKKNLVASAITVVDVFTQRVSQDLTQTTIVE